MKQSSASSLPSCLDLSHEEFEDLTCDDLKVSSSHTLS